MFKENNHQEFQIKNEGEGARGAQLSAAPTTQEAEAEGPNSGSRVRPRLKGRLETQLSHGTLV